MLTVRLYDGNSYYRTLLETDISGLVYRTQLEALKDVKDVCFFMWDPVDNKEKRLKTYPEYKQGRKPMGEDIFKGMSFFKEMLKHLNVNQITVPKYEADDVIATLACRFVAQGHQVLIYSNDKDLIQLEEMPNVLVGAGEIENVEPHMVRLYKTLVGDPSDHIPGVKGFGKKTWENADKEQLLTWAKGGFRLEEFNTGTFGIAPKFNKSLTLEIEQIRIFWDIIGFYDVPMSEIEDVMITGSLNYPAADALLKEQRQ